MRLVGSSSAPEPLNVLLVDPDEAAAYSLRRGVERWPRLRLSYAADGAAAWAMLAARAWDLVVVDPAMTRGFEFVRAVRQRPWISILVLTQLRVPHLLRAVECGVNAIELKPIASAAFLKRALALAEEVVARRHRLQRRVLAIGAHPDDVEIGCGGSLARHGARGDRLHILTLSRGAAGGDETVRVAEATRAAEILGATLSFGDLPDTRIGDGIETIEVIRDAIDRLEPTHVYTHCAEDTHQDHRAVHAASLAAARRVPNVYCYQSSSATRAFQPNRFTDIAGYIAQKLAASAVYESQRTRVPALREEAILVRAQYWGHESGHRLAEPISIVRQRAGRIDCTL
ncbi:MAG: PIG-L family deacetylase [Reyranellaceae bacterium]